MSFLSAFFYDRCMKATENACLMDWRKNLLRNVDGAVLEIGAGTGASLDLYPHSPTLQISLAEPDKDMRAQLEYKLINTNLGQVSVLSCPSERINSDDEVFDFVFASLVCCSVNDVEASLKEIKRVLKPNGSFIFLEHVAANNGTVRRKWQNRVNPIWRKLAGNCHLNRETEKSIIDAGFYFLELKHESMRKAMPLVRPTIRGVAKKS
jgi:ubiquinone/menaquinone biosynthesis C-methylase UbiE